MREGIAWDVSPCARPRRFQHERVRCERLTSEDGTVFWHGCFKAFGVDALVREFTLLFALSVPTDASDVSEDIAEPTSEDVAFIGRHRERFLDGIGEAVSGETEILEHDSRTRLRISG